MGFLDKLRGVVDERTRLFNNEFKRLNDAQDGLGKKASSYVLTGENETCLATVSNLVTAQGFNLFYHVQMATSSALLCRYLFKDADIDLAVLARYGRLLAAMNGHDESFLAGTKNVPLPLRVLASLFFRMSMEHHSVWRGMFGPNWKNYPTQNRTNRTGLTISRFMELAALLDGGPVDVFDLLFQDDGQWKRVNSTNYLELSVDPEPFVRADLDSALAAGSRIHAKGRAAFMSKLIEWKLETDPRVVDFLMDEAGSSSKTTSERAVACLSSAPKDQVEKLATERLNSGNATVRASMVHLLGLMNTESARKLLQDRLATEKTAKVKSAITATLTVAEAQEKSDGEPDDHNSYLAIDGSRVSIPAFRALEHKPRNLFDKSDLQDLSDIVGRLNAEDRARYDKAKAEGIKYAYLNQIDSDFAQSMIHLLNGKSSRNFRKNQYRYGFLLSKGDLKTWFDRALGRLNEVEKLRLAYEFSNNAIAAASGYGFGEAPSSGILQHWLDSPDGDFRQFIVWDLNADREVFYNHQMRQKKEAVTLRTALDKMLEQGWGRSELLNHDLTSAAFWPYFAQNMDALSEAFGLKPLTGVPLSKLAALKAVSHFPKTPMRFFAPVLEIATGSSTKGRDLAKQLLEDVEGIDERLISLLDDGRQSVRAGVADWLGSRGTNSALPALKTRLKKEKSEIARAAILSAMEKLGEDLQRYIGPKALTDEAEKGIGKAKFDKLDWLAFNTLSNYRFRHGKPVPDTVLKYLIYQAFKLKQPGGNKLFDLYLDQLDPESAERFSSWVFDSWMAYDTAVASDDEANAKAREMLPQRWKQHQQWIKSYSKYYSGQEWLREMESMTEDRLLQSLKREVQGNYLNSGAATKGLLGLATRAPAASKAASVRAYLKNHGSRTSQASSLLEMLAASGDPVSLQVVITAATRLKQKSVQKRAGELLQEVADEKNWTMDELADRTIPTAGFDDTGVLELPCTPLEKLYTAVLDEDLKLILRNPDGKTIKALPGGDDENTKASKKTLSTARKESKQVVSMQSQRLYEALCAERSWSPEDWERDFRSHPLMGQLTQRLVWLCMDAEGKVKASFRPTAEGELIDAEDEEVSADCDHIRLAHGALLDETAVDAWVNHLKDYEVKPLFRQFGRNSIRLAERDKDLTSITDRLGWLAETFTFRGTASKLGYERGEALDGGWFYEYSKTFRSADIKAVIEFTGSALPEENIPAALKELRFVRLTARGRSGGDITLSKVPPVLLSECWNDYHDMAAKAKFDADWEKKSEW